MDRASAPPGRLLRAPENFLDAKGVGQVLAESRAGRRDFIRQAFAAATAAPLVAAQAKPVLAEGDANILQLPEHSRKLGLPVLTEGYGKPSKFETQVQRRPSPGLTQTPQSSVSFSPLQSLFGIVTPSGLHFERHHQGWWDIDPSKHRLMVNGSDDQMLKKPLVLISVAIMRAISLPFSSRGISPRCSTCQALLGRFDCCNVIRQDWFLVQSWTSLLRHFYRISTAFLLHFYCISTALLLD